MHKCGVLKWGYESNGFPIKTILYGTCNSSMDMTTMQKELSTNNQLSPYPLACFIQIVSQVSITSHKKFVSKKKNMLMFTLNMFWIIILYIYNLTTLKNDNFTKRYWNHQNSVKGMFFKGWKPSLGSNLGLHQIRFSQFGSQNEDLQSNNLQVG
jgi:hypothetical protein